jgi:hypothetical protein
MLYENDVPCDVRVFRGYNAPPQNGQVVGVSAGAPLHVHGARMRSMRKTCDAAFKDWVALEAIKGESTVAELSGRYEAHVSQISKREWEALRGRPDVFSEKAWSAGGLR